MKRDLTMRNTKMRLAGSGRAENFHSLEKTRAGISSLWKKPVPGAGGGGERVV